MKAKRDEFYKNGKNERVLCIKTFHRIVFWFLQMYYNYQSKLII